MVELAKMLHRNQDGIESTELAGIIALFVVVAVVAFGSFGSQLSSFIQSLPGMLGF
jgi:hypothetical protein